MNRVLTGSWQERVCDIEAGSVAMIYADPPYGTGRTFTRYNDTQGLDQWSKQITELMQHAVSMLRAGGVMWVHLDDNRGHHARILGDQVFGSGAHVGTIAWRRNSALRGDTSSLARQTDFILGWSTPGFKLRKLPKSDYSQSLYASPDGDEHLWRRDTLPAPGSGSPNCRYGITNPFTEAVYWPGDGRHWRWQMSRSLEALSEWGRWDIRVGPDGSVLSLHAEDLGRAESLQREGPWPLIYFGTTGKHGPLRKSYHTPGTTPGNFWDNQDTGTTSDAIRELTADIGRHNFPTPKPIGLLSKLITISTDVGDLVLDPHAGSGTTGVAAHLAERRFVLIEQSASTVADIVIPRLHRRGITF